MLEDLHLPADGQPMYRRLADAIAERIASGALAGGDKLPPQREIARALGINVTTVTRAFSALQQRGLVEARPGRGTSVLIRNTKEDAGFRSAPSDETGLIDLSVNRPATTAYLDGLAPLLPRLAKDRRYPALQDYHPPEGPLWAREAAAEWLAAYTGTNDAGRVVLTDGAQHGLSCLLTAVAQRGDVIVADAITYQGIGALCRSLGLDLRGISGDRDGMRPDAFEAACATLRPRAVFLVPSLHNPTTVTLSEERRRAIAAVARRHNVLIIEDDVYRPLVEEPIPSFASIEPELTLYVSCLSKCVAPGLRLGFVAGPRAVMGNVAAALRVNCWSVSPLTALVTTILLEEGIADQLIARQKEELRQRQAVLRENLAGFDVQTQATSTHAWLHLPEPWRGAAFARASRQRGVGVLPADAFAVGREVLTHAVRINVGAARSQADLRRALETLVELMNFGHLEVTGVV
ncbi:MAG: PLP-dependent aminotransferase family protein [Hyphomicrobiales bacterium]|nr:PLP-dependent aminotransferase family protein [Hyphomicrobiales bacterium]